MSNIVKLENNNQKKRNKFLPDLVKVGGRYVSVNEVKNKDINENSQAQYIVSESKINIRTESSDRTALKYENILETFLHEILHAIDTPLYEQIFKGNEFLLDFTSNKLHDILTENPNFIKLFKDEYIQSDNFLEHIPKRLLLFGDFFDIYTECDDMYFDMQRTLICYNFTKNKNKFNDNPSLNSFFIGHILFEIINLHHCKLKSMVHDQIESSVPNINVHLLVEKIYMVLNDNPKIIDLYREQSNKLLEIIK